VGAVSQAQRHRPGEEGQVQHEELHGYADAPAGRHAEATQRRDGGRRHTLVVRREGGHEHSAQVSEQRGRKESGIFWARQRSTILATGESHFARKAVTASASKGTLRLWTR